MRRLILLVLPLLAAPQDKAEYQFTWGLPPDMAADYSVLEAGASGTPKKDRFFLIFGADLRKDGGNNLMINTYEDVPWSFAFALPKEKVKIGAKWTVERTLFDRGSEAAAPEWAFRPVAVRGVETFRKIERIEDVECARIDGSYQVFEIKIHPETGTRTPTNKEVAQFSTATWFSVQKTLLVRGRVEFKGKGDTFKEVVAQGDGPRSRTMEFGERIELKKDLVKIDQLIHRDRIHEAIRKGVEALRRQQRKDGTWRADADLNMRRYPEGMTALGVMALLHSGVSPDDPQVRVALSHLRAAPFRRVYDVSAILMAIETRHLPLEKFEDIQALTEPGARDAIAKSITPEDRAFVEKAANWLLAAQRQNGTWGYEPGSFESYDHSNTQYAMLALKSAARCGVEIGAEAWSRAADHWIRSQRVVLPKVGLRLTWFSEAEAGIDRTTRTEELFRQGSWGYFTAPMPGLAPDKGSGSMTCAGLTSLLIAESELARLGRLDDGMRREIDTAKKQGLAWLQENFSVRGCPPETGFWNMFYTYYLFSLERVGVLYGIRKFGDRDWYPEGALALVHRQRADGLWNLYLNVPVLDTSFALLFLKKATLRVATGSAGKK